MENPGVSKYATSFGLSLAAGSVANALLVIAKETSPSVQAAMQRLTGSHWITHVAIVLFVFVACGGLLVRANGGQGPAIPASKLIRAIVGAVIVAAIIIVGFYLFAD